MSRITDHKGTYRFERFPKALAADYFKLDNRSVEDLMEQTTKLASHIKFYNAQNLVDGNWELFFEDIYDYVLEAEAQVHPHLALYFAFIEVFQIAQDELNRFTQRHLDYYYNNILKFERKNAVADQVHLFFGIGGKETKAMVPRGTVFEGGNDNNGKKRLYASNFDVIVNKSEIDRIKTVTIDDFESAVQDNILSDGTPRPFELGFALSSPVLYLKDGIRRIEVRFDSDEVAKLVQKFNCVEYSTAEGWQSVEVSDSNNGNKIVLEVTKAMPPFAGYSEPMHQMYIQAKDPVLRFVLGTDTDSLSNDDLFKLLALPSSLVSSITVDVKESADLLLYNDYGKVSNGVPFLPFGHNPIVGSSRFLIRNNKIFNKYLKSFGFSLEWRGLPDNLISYYSSYQEGMKLLNADYVRFKDGIKKFDKEKEHGSPSDFLFMKDGEWSKLSKGQKIDGKGKISVSETPLFSCQGDQIRETLTEYTNDIKSGFVKVVLTTDFGHNMYGKLLSKVMMENTKMVEGKEGSGNQSLTVPEKPYLPEMQNILIDYELFTDVSKDECQLFAVHPFMNVELDGKNKPLLYQVHAPAIELQKGQSQKCYYFGVANVNAGSGLSVYFDIDNPIINDGNEYLWSYFGQGRWMLFEESKIVRDNTEKLGKSGIVTFALPEDAELADDRIWLCLSAVGKENRFPTVLSARTNCVTATFVDDGNELSHLKSGLPAQTIQKFVERNPKIKTVEQPYLSFGGKEAENDLDYYTRVSERLRHKGRASTVWDYERLALDAFPQISFALCIPHARLNDTDNEIEFAPGCVAMLVCPDVDVIRQEDMFKPVVPAVVIMEIRNYLKGLSSSHVSIDVWNFKYKEVKVTCEVHLKKEFSDVSYYRDKLNSDLRTFISPWTGDGDEKFDRSMTYNSKNVADVYSFLEQLEYVDFVVSAKITVDGKTYTIADKTIEKNQNEIFTSAENHIITIK